MRFLQNLRQAGIHRPSQDEVYETVLASLTDDELVKQAEDQRNLRVKPFLFIEIFKRNSAVICCLQESLMMSWRQAKAPGLPPLDFIQGETERAAWKERLKICMNYSYASDTHRALCGFILHRLSPAYEHRLTTRIVQASLSTPNFDNRWSDLVSIYAFELTEPEVEALLTKAYAALESGLPMDALTGSNLIRSIAPRIQEPHCTRIFQLLMRQLDSNLIEIYQDACKALNALAPKLSQRQLRDAINRIMSDQWTDPQNMIHLVNQLDARRFDAFFRAILSHLIIDETNQINSIANFSDQVLARASRTQVKQMFDCLLPYLEHENTNYFLQAANCLFAMIHLLDTPETDRMAKILYRYWPSDDPKIQLILAIMYYMLGKVLTLEDARSANHWLLSMRSSPCPIVRESACLALATIARRENKRTVCLTFKLICPVLTMDQMQSRPLLRTSLILLAEKLDSNQIQALFTDLYNETVTAVTLGDWYRSLLPLACLSMRLEQPQFDMIYTELLRLQSLGYHLAAVFELVCEAFTFMIPRLNTPQSMTLYHRILPTLSDTRPEIQENARRLLTALMIRLPKETLESFPDAFMQESLAVQFLFRTRKEGLLAALPTLDEQSRTRKRICTALDN